MTGISYLLLALVVALALLCVYLMRPHKSRGGYIDLTGADFTDDEDDGAVVFDWTDPRRPVHTPRHVELDQPR